MWCLKFRSVAVIAIYSLMKPLTFTRPLYRHLGFTSAYVVRLIKDINYKWYYCCFVVAAAVAATASGVNPGPRAGSVHPANKNAQGKSVWASLFRLPPDNNLPHPSQKCTGATGYKLPLSLLVRDLQSYLRNRRWGGCIYVLQMFFFRFFPFSVFFPSVTKIPDNRSQERLNGFSWNFYQTIAEKM